MKLKQNFSNSFICVFVINNVEYLDQLLYIDYHISSDKKYFYKISSNNNYINDFFTDKFIKGVKGFGQHIVSTDNYYLVYKEKLSQIEIITRDNSLFVYGKLLTKN